ncbi:MAG: hypothetical protein ACR2PA_15030 [Hyphomicrobiaceae bacterium]
MQKKAIRIAFEGLRDALVAALSTKSSGDDVIALIDTRFAALPPAAIAAKPTSGHRL